MIKGIDVSSIQGACDWQKIRAFGIEFAWCRVTVVGQDKAGVRRIWRDSRARENLQNGRAAGVRMGGYAFFSPALDPVAQADEFVTALGDVQRDDLKPVIDFEVTHGVPMTEATKRAIRFVERVEELTGVECVVYTMSGLSGFWPHNIDAGLLAERSLWVAHYHTDPNTGRRYTLNAPTIPPQWKVWSAWQVSGNKGERVDGIGWDVDRNEVPTLEPLLAYPVADTDPAPPPFNERHVPVEVPRAEDFVRGLAEDES